ncbi:FxsA family protein [Thalassobius sp. S69A]|uniref:FxsA family protein n=1 Tax=unclassified Thalassovita TaxID=2619711 RepID=UPI000C110991|nr:exlusion protein FxsA [Paracoccaceae bacterium]MBT26559.1 exlusion protein FxsA [Paracoccaceae bacterium]|tara:strand:+ start:138 stop:617 length:480 start_codon:yes stop_codon:yes gene_type:complete
MWLLIAFIAVPIIEIALFIQVGGAIGTWPTLGIVILTAILGTSLMRAQGRLAMGNLQRSFAELDDPTEPLAHGAMVLISGVLLLTPGFFTDAMGFALLIPAVRSAVFHYLRKRVKVQSFSMGAGPMHQPRADSDTIDGEFYEIDPGNRTTHRPSGWTKH